MYLLDTDILSLLHANHVRVSQRIRQVDRATVATTIISKIQILQATYAFILKAADGKQLVRAQYWLSLSESQLNALPIIPIDENVATEFERLRLDRRFRKIGRADLLIAAIALANRAILVTRNLRHFQQVPNLTLENRAD